MPSTATITAFYTFTQNTKARASQVNTNFNVLRGHIIPIDPNTTTSVDNTYDLGSSEHRWRTGYFGSLNIISNTTTGKDLAIVGNTSTTDPAFVFNISGNESFRINSIGAATATVSPVALKTRAVYNGVTAAVSGLAFSAGATATTDLSTYSSTNIVGSTLTILTTGRAVEVGFFTSDPGQNPINLLLSASTTAATVTCDISFTMFLYRDTTTAIVAKINYDHTINNVISTSSGFGFLRRENISGYFSVDTPSAGAPTYWLAALINSANTTTISRVAQLTNYRLFAKEIF